MNKIKRFEIPAEDPIKLQEFYKKVFDWKFTKWNGPTDYWEIDIGYGPQGEVSGGMEGNKGRIKTIVNVVDVKNIDKVIEAINSSGGKITVPKMEVPGMGWMIYFKDPDGNTFGAFQEKKK